MNPEPEKISPVNLRFLLLMRHAQRERKEPKRSVPNRVDDMAASLRRIAHLPTERTISHSLSGNPAEKVLGRVLSERGIEETRAIAKRLHEFIEESTDAPNLVGVLSAMSDEAKETTDVFCRRFESSSPTASDEQNEVRPEITGVALIAPRTKAARTLAKAELPKLTPRMVCDCPVLRDGKQESFALALRNVVVTEAEAMLKEGGNAILVVGHQPSLSWLSHAFVGEAHPVANSEILCLDLKQNIPPKLLWSMAFLDERTVPELQEKIRSKMTLANVLSGFITAGIALLLGMLAEKEKMKALGVQGPVALLAGFALLVAVGLYLLTMFSYDSLLMPTRFWAEAPSGARHRPTWIVVRPPSGAHWILYQNMIRVWQYQFMPATFFAVSGLFMLWAAIALGGLPISHSCQWKWSAASRALSLSVPIAVLVGIIWSKAKAIAAAGSDQRNDFWSCPGLVMKFRHICGPWLGSED